MEELSEVNSNSSKSSDNSRMSPISLSFAGCGFLSFYYVGVTACLQKYSHFNDNIVICGASSGTIPGLAIILNLPIGENVAQLLELAINVSAKPLGIIHPSCDMHKMIYDILMKVLPNDCHQRVSGRLYVSLTRVIDGKNVIISQFDSKEDLIRVIQCSSFMPFLFGISPPKYKGVAYIDGALSNNSPKINERTITVSPWTGEFDICPMNDISLPYQVMFYNKLITLSPLNIYRMSQIAFPPPSDVKTILCQQGFEDTFRYLLRNNMISCIQCLTTQPFLSTISEDSEEEERQSDDSGFDVRDEPKSSHIFYDCSECQQKQRLTLNESIPEAISNAIEESFHRVNKSVINRLSQQTSIKILIMIFVPILLLLELIISLTFGIFKNEWSFDIFSDILSVSKIMINNGLTGRDIKNTHK